MLGRRGFLGGVGAAAAGVAVARLEQARAGASGAPGGAASSSAAGPAGVATAVAGVLDAHGVRAGAKFGACTVLEVKTLDDGALGVTLAASDGEHFELELLGHDPLTPGVARAGSLAVYVTNRGRGVTATNEEHGLAAMALATHLARREAAGATLPALPTLAERSRVVRAV